MKKKKLALLGMFILVLLGMGRGRVVAADRIVVMPFENRSQMGEYNWIRESFPIIISEVLDAPGIYVLSTGERNLAFDRLRLSPNDLLTRASMIRVAEAAQANLALIGEFDIGGEKDGVTIAVTARLVETTEGRLVANKVFNFSGPLSNLQQIQGQLAWNILYLRNPSLPYTKDQFVRKATSAPPLAYQSYVKAVQTADQKLRESFLRRAIQEFENSGEAGHFGAAIHELGMLSYRQANHAEAVKQFKQLDKGDRHYDESLFYLGLAAYRLGNFEEMTLALTTLAQARPMLEVFNNLGVGLAARGDLANALLALQRAVANSPQDALYRFNYGYALWRSQQPAEAIPHLRVVVQANPRDGEALYLLSKCLSSAGQEAEASSVDNEAKRHLESYARWAVNPEAIPLLGRLKPELDLARFYQLEKRQASGEGPSVQQMTIRQSLDRARAKLTQNDEAGALGEIQNVLVLEGNNAEAHLLRGLVLQRRGEIEGALSALQSAVTWDPRLIDAHLALGKIFQARGDRARALSHANQALAIDPQNRGALALKQQIEIGR